MTKQNYFKNMFKNSNYNTPFPINSNVPYGKGYAFPRPLISKLSIISALQNKYQFIGLTLDLFQNFPELFKTTATNLLYLLQTGTSYKKDSILTLFEALFNS